MLQIFAFYPRILIKTPQQYRNLINTWNGKKNLYRSVYHFDLKNGKPDFFNIIINQIFVEFDNDNSHEVSKKFAQELLKDNIKFRINFSGRRGFHFYISCEHKDIDRKSYLNALHQYIINKYNITNDVDHHIIGNINQLRRIENTLNIRGNLYCIPITYQELTSLTFDKIKELAGKPRNYVTSWVDGNNIKLDNIKLTNINEKYISNGDGKFKEIDDILPEPCMVRILNLIHPTQEERFLLCMWLSHHFRDGKDIKDFNLDELKEKVISFMRTRNWDDYSEAVNTSKSTRYQVNNILNKKFNFVPSCKWRKMYNICISEFCWNEKHKL
jgi:hypothetical protein